MNREIKFRGRRLDNKEWVHGYFYNMPIRNIVASFILTNDFLEEFKDGTRDYELGFHLWKDLFPVDKNTIGQFTGLYDKKGTPIYEGDIVDAWSARHHITCGVIRYVPPRFLIGLYDEKRKEFNGSWYLSPNAFGKDELLEVIGNIHDNPELLNGTS